MSPRTRPVVPSRARTATSWFARLAVLVVAALVAGLVTPTAAVAAVPVASSQLRPLEVTSSDATLLAGSSTTVTLQVANRSGGTATDLYNATAVAILPPGVTYVPGSSPYGEPSARPWVPDGAAPGVTGTVLVWENVADLVVGTELELPFQVTADDASHPVGSSFRIGGGVYATTDERVLPVVTVPTAGPPTVGLPAGAAGQLAGGSAEQTTTVTPLLLQKSVSEAEDEVYRGAAREHVFTVQVTNAPKSPTERVEVVDLLPAVFRLVECATCTSTEVVQVGGTVFTRLVWSLGTVGGESTRELSYTVRIDETEQTMPGETTPGAPTRPGASGTGVENTVTATGRYTGLVAKPADVDVSTTASKTVNVVDLGVVKTADTTRFAVNGTAVFTLRVTGSSITDANGITLTDVIPDGMCPLVPAGVRVTGVPWPAACPAPGSSSTAGTATGATMTTAEAKADGTFVITFALAPLPGTAGPVEVGYRTHLRADYAGGSQTSAGDAFDNVVTVRGTVQPAPTNQVDRGAVVSDNGSSHEIGTERVTISKQVWQNPQRTPLAGTTSCPAADSAWSSAQTTVARFGDLVCFRVSAQLPSGVPVRDALLTDFIPQGTELVSAAGGPRSTVAFTRAAGPGVSWHVGTKVGDHYYAAAGGRMELLLVLRVVSAPATQPQVTGNLAKLRYVSASGEVLSARSEADFTLAPPVPLALTKTATPTTVHEGQEVAYSITVANRGSAATRTDQPVDVIEVWDALPAGFTCSSVVTGSVVPAFRDCGVASAAGSAFGGRSILRWVVPASERGGQLAPGATTELKYRLTMPAPMRIGTQHQNTAAVTRYTVPTTDGTATPAGSSTLVPTSPFGTVHGTPNAPQATDDATVSVPNAVVTKSATTEITAAGNGAAQATVGEAVSYAYSVRIPGRTTVYGGRLVDRLPANIVRTGDATMTVSTGAAFDTVAACPSPTATVTRITLCADGTVVFPETWTNPAAGDAVFTVTLPARMTATSPTVPAHGQTAVNTAEFSAKATPGPTVPRTLVDDATATVTAVLPTAGIAKSVLAPADGGTVTAGSAVTFRLIASNPTAGRPPLYGWTVADCAPAALQLTGASVSRGAFAADPSVSCAAGQTGYRWTGDAAPLLPNAPATADVTFRIPDDAPAGFEYVNVARITGRSHPTSPDAREITADPAEARVRVTDPIITKTVDKPTAVEGERLTWTVTARIPANATVYAGALVDTLGTQLGDAADVTWGVPVCTGGDASWSSGCGELFQRRVDTAPGSGVQRTGQYLGDLAPSAAERIVTVTLSTKVPLTTQNAQRTVRNDAELLWFFTPQQNGSALPSAPDARATDGVSTTVLHPAVVLGKTSSTASPQPGQDFDYTLNASVAAGANARTAYAVTVVDRLPVGVEFVSAPSAGAYDPSSRTLTWTVEKIEPGTTASLRYTARLADAATLDGSRLRNTAQASWTSLDDPGSRGYQGTPVVRDVTPAFPKVNAAKSVTAPSSKQVLLGQNASYQILLTNVGGADARQVDAVDVLPKGWEYQPGSARVTVPGAAAVATEPAATAQDEVQTLSWTNLLPGGRVLAPNQSIVITLDAHPTTAGALAGIGLAFEQRNTAKATRVVDLAGSTSNKTGADAYLGTTATASAQVAKADLQVTKTAGEIVAGRTTAWTVTVRNLGPDPARGVAVRDELTPVAGLRLTGATGAGWSCTAPASDALSCVRSNANETLASGGSWTFTVTAAVDAGVADGTRVTNAAIVSSSTHDPDPSNDRSTVTGTVQTRADLELTKTAGAATVVAGEQLSWTLALRNLGPSVSRADAAKPVTIRDILPDAVTNVQVASTSAGVACTVTGQRLDCVIEQDLPVGTVHTVALRGTVHASTPASAGSVGRLDNTAKVTSGTTVDPVPGNDSSTSSTAVTTFDRLSIAKNLVSESGEAAEVVPGETFTYEVTVTGQGPSDSRGIRVTDVLPADTTFVGIPDDIEGWTHVGTAGRQVSFAYDGVLEPGASAVLRYEVLLGPSVTGTIVNSAVAVSTSGTPTEVVEAPSGTQPKADLGVRWAEPRTAVVPGGDAVPLRATVTNSGPSTAHDGKVTFRFPADVTVVSGPDCEISMVPGAPLTLVCDVRNAAGGFLETDETAVFDFTVTVGPAQTSSPTVSALTSMSVQDVRPSNNADTTVLDPTALTKLAITKTPDAATVDAGGLVTWTVTATAQGPSDARNVHVIDTLPVGLVLDGAPVWRIGEAAATECAVPTDGAFDCTVGTLARGATVTVTVHTRVPASVPLGSELANTAAVTSTTTDPDTGSPARETATGRVTTTVASEVHVVKRSSTESVVAGTTATFTLDVRNDGVSDAAAPVTVTDFLPAGMAFAGTTSGGAASWRCDPVDGVVTCVLVDSAGEPTSLAAGANAPQLTVTATAAADLAPGPITNRATAQSHTDPGDEDTSTVEIVTNADLRITKTHAAGARLLAGTPFAWTLTVRNDGPSDSVASESAPIVVRDVLPAGVTLADGADPRCASVGDEGGRAVVECRIAQTLPVGEHTAVDLVVDTAADLRGTVANTASVTPGLTPLPDEDPREGTDRVPSEQEADLTVTKTGMGETAVAGAEYSWTVQVRNHGPSVSVADEDAEIVVRDLLPAGVRFVSGEGDGWTCRATTDVGERRAVECARTQSLPLGDAPVIRLTGVVASDRTGELVNNAVVRPGTTPQPEEHRPDDTSSTTPVTQSANLSVVKTLVGELVAGADAQYRLVVRNAGPSDALGVTVADPMPPGLTATAAWSVDEADCLTAGGRGVTCTLGRLPAGASIEILVDVHVAPGLTGSVTNLAMVQSATPDPDPTDNRSTVVTDVITKADLQIVKSHVGLLPAGGAFDWTLTVTNHGPSDSVATESQPITVVDLLPAGLTFVSSDPAVCTAGEATSEGQTVTCPISQTLHAGAEATIRLTVQAASTLTGTAANTARVTPGVTPLPDGSPRETVDVAEVLEEADLSVAKTALQESAVAGTELQWRIDVANHGPADSEASEDHPISVVDTLPAGVSFVAAAGDGWTCRAGDEVEGREQVVCERVESLDVGAAPPITVTGRVGSGVLGEVVNHVTVAPGLTDQPEDDLGPDEAISTTPVLTSADVVLTKTVARTIVAGAQGEYRLHLTNVGPSDARDVVVSDDLPAGITFASADGEGWACEADGQTVSCALAEPLAAGASTAVTLVVDAAADLDGDLANTAVATSSTPDPDEANNTSTVTGTVTTFADVSMRKTVEGDAVVGGTLVYTLQVDNAGPSESRGLVVTDATPAGLVDVTVAAEGWTCAVDADGVVTCVLAVLAPGTSAAPITVTGTVAPAAYPELSNTATVIPATPQRDPEAPDGDDPTADDSSTATVAIPPASALRITKELVGDLAAGEAARYRITVENTGVTEDPGPVHVVDQLPAALALAGASVEHGEGACRAAGNGAVCEIARIGAGERATVLVDVRVSADATGTVVNVATVASAASTDGKPIAASAAAPVRPAPGGLSVTGAAVGTPIALVLLAAGIVLLAVRRGQRA